MKILFISSHNEKNGGITPFIYSQANSITEMGINVEHFTIKKGGVLGYIRSIIELKKILKINKYDILHAHYCLSGWVAVLANISSRKSIVLSLMGSDAYGNYVGNNKVLLSSRLLTILTLLIQPFVDVIISKSANIEKYVYLKKKSYIVPNGVDLDLFHSSKSTYFNELSLSNMNFNILFLGDKNNPRKNYNLLDRAVKAIDPNSIRIVAPYPINQELVVKYFNTVNLFVSCAFMEGSPNVIKEAMACNCPILTTDVGDAKYVIGNTPGCYSSTFDVDEFASKIKQSIDYSKVNKKTKGRDRVIELGLDSKSIALKILSIYKETQN